MFHGTAVRLIRLRAANGSSVRVQPLLGSLHGHVPEVFGVILLFTLVVASQANVVAAEFTLG